VIENVMTRVDPGVKGMPSDKVFNTAEASADGHANNKFIFSLAEDADYSRFPTSSNSCTINGTTVLEKVPNGQHPGLESEREKSNKQALDPDNLESSTHLPYVSVVDKVPPTHRGAYRFTHNSSKMAVSLSDPSVRSEAAGVVPNILSTEKKNARQQTAPKVTRHYSSKLVNRTV
jgi:ubiquitin carboxyl-terminal hydrolase 36/42